MDDTLFERHPATALLHRDSTTSPSLSMTSSPNSFDYAQNVDVVSGDDRPIDFSVKRPPVIANGNRVTTSPQHPTTGNRSSSPGRSVSSTADDLSRSSVGVHQFPATGIVPPRPAMMAPPSGTSPAVILPVNARFPGAAAAAAALDPLTYARLQGLAALAMQSQPLGPSQLLAQASSASNSLTAVAPLMTSAGALPQAVLPVSVPVNPTEALIAAHYRTMQMIADEQRRLVQLQQALVSGSTSSRLGAVPGGPPASAGNVKVDVNSVNVKVEGNSVANNNNQNGAVLTSPTTAGVVSGSEDAFSIRQAASLKPRSSSEERNGNFGVSSGQAAHSPDSGNSEIPLSSHFLPSSFGDGSSALSNRKRGRSYPERSSPPRHQPHEDHFENLPVMASGGDSAVSGSGGIGGRDSAYYERRRKNNEAAKRSRDARRAKEEEIAMKAAYLEQENRKLQVELVTLREEVNRLNELLFMRGPMAARAALAAAVAATPAGAPAASPSGGTG